MATRTRISQWIAVAGIVATAVSIGMPAVAAADPNPSLEYVNLGDSFSAGSGVSPMAPGEPLECWQSTQNFSHIIAEQRGYQLTDASCGGAKTDDFYRRQYPDTAPQLDSLSPTTELVTLMIGGNNNDTFRNAMAACIGALATHPGAFDPCETQYGASLTDPIGASTYPALVAALGDIHTKSPNAQVVIAGYPWLLPASGSCIPEMPIAEGDVPYLRGLQATLNDAVKRAARETNSTFVDMSQASEGRDGCQPVGQRLVEPMVFSQQPVPVHPNADGERALAGEVLKAIG